MLRLAVLPLIGMDGEGFFRQRIGIALAELREFNLGERIEAGGGREVFGRGDEA
jgi:hypothetical protein